MLRSVLGAALAGVLALAAPAEAQDVPVQDPPTAEVGVEGIDVVGQRLREATRTFVRQAAAPSLNRNPATWPDRVCVGVINLRGHPAQALIERISAVAATLELEPGEEGCRPNVIIHFTDDADEAARRFAQELRRGFRVGLSGSDRGETAFRAFQTSDRPVRWWHVSVPVNADTGISQARIPGAAPPAMEGGGTRPGDFGPMAAVIQPSRIHDPLRDSLTRVVIIVDVDEIQAVTFAQLADYLSMVALAQIDPDADMAAFDSILSIFDVAGPPELTSWDMAYLAGLYGAEQNMANPSSNTSSIADIMARQLRAEQAE